MLKLFVSKQQTGGKMKNLIIKLSLVIALVVACNTASAVFTDNLQLQLLMHCDATNQAYWLITPDDNSSGRAVNEPILDMAIGSFAFDRTTEPVMMPGSPAGGSYLSFDGVNDTVYCSPGWTGGTDVNCDFSLRWLGLPPVSNPYSALVQTVPWRCFLQPNGDQGYISFLMGATFLTSTVMLDSNVWYDVSFSIINDQAKLTVNGTTVTATIPIVDSVAQIMIGYDLYGLDRFFYGDLDEIRVGNIPEPITFGLIGLLGFFIIRRK